jgi:uncharacterized protein (TIGR02186 family)
VIRNVFVIAIVCAIVCPAGLGLTPGDARAATNLRVAMHPEQIRMGAGYDGAQVLLTGKLPADAAALVRVVGPAEHARLKEKGRALGVLWMNMGSVEIANAPNVFLLYLPEEGGDILAAGGAPEVGLQGLHKQVEIVAADADKDALFDEFVKLKEKTGLYGTFADAIQYGPAEGDLKPFKATLALPAALPQGRYSVQVLAVANGAVTASDDLVLDAHEVGLPSWISTFAFDHGTLYGIFAVVVAVIAGLLTGIIFRGEGGAH